MMCNRLPLLSHSTFPSLETILGFSCFRNSPLPSPPFFPPPAYSPGPFSNTNVDFCDSARRQFPVVVPFFSRWFMEPLTVFRMYWNLSNFLARLLLGLFLPTSPFFQPSIPCLPSSTALPNLLAPSPELAVLYLARSSPRLTFFFWTNHLGQLSALLM